jgi:hypothetical protein
MNKFDRWWSQTVCILIFSLILISIFAPIMNIFQPYPDFCNESGDNSVLSFFPEGEGQAFLNTSQVYRAVFGKAQPFRYSIFIILALLLLFKIFKASVFVCSSLFIFLIKRFNISVLAFSLGGRAPPVSRQIQLFRQYSH